MRPVLPDSWQCFETVDAHTAGEPLRVVVSGWPEIRGDSILQKRRYAREHHDGLRRTLMWEPRGHANMYGCIPTTATTEDGDLGVLFLHNEGFSTMCGHGIIALVKVALECGLIEAAEGANTLRIDTPAGRVTARTEVQQGRVGPVSFVNVPSFLLREGLIVPVSGLGKVTCDIAFGGAFYAYVDAAEAGVPIAARNARQIIDVGMAIKEAVMEEHEIRHPDGDEDLNFLYGTILVEMTPLGPAHSKNACVFADGELDRCPTGTGVSGRAAIHHARGELGLEESIRIQSVIGSSFDVQAIAATTVGGLPAIVPEVTGEAFLTGRHSFLVDPEDPLRAGFLLS